MKGFFTSLLVAGMAVLGWGQVYYSEDFTGQDGKGKVGTSAVDLTGVPWTIDVSDGDFTATNDFFAVQMNIFEAQDVDGDVIWTSETFSIASAVSLEFSFDAFADGDFEAGLDVFDVEIFIDGTPQVLFSGIVDENAPGDPMFFGSTQLNGTLQSFTANISGTGTNAYIEITANNNAGSEIYGWDNLQVVESNNCGITSLSTATYNCATNTAGADNDNVTVEIPYTGLDASASLSITVDGSSATNTGDDPAMTANGTIAFAASEGDNWSVSISGGSCSLSDNGTVPSNECDPTTCMRVIGFNSDNPDEVLLEAMSSIPPNTTFYLTDNEWNSSTNSFDDLNENEETWVSPASSIPAGSYILLSGTTATCGTSSGVPQLGTSGEEIYVTTVDPSGTVNSNDICFSVSFGGTGDLTGSEGSIDLGNIDNASFNGGVITNSSNWTTSNSRITFNDESCAGAPLPITLTTFTATPRGKEALLQWATEVELNNDYMAIEHSPDGRRYTEIGRVLGAGTTQEPQDYSFVHEAPAPGLNYYRLRQVDFDGQHAYHGPVSLRMEVPTAGPQLTAFPTIAQDAVTVQYEGDLRPAATLEVYSLEGRLWHTHRWEEKSTGQTILPTAQLPPGVYILRLAGTGKVARFIKQ